MLRFQKEEKEILLLILGWDILSRDLVNLELELIGCTERDAETLIKVEALGDKARDVDTQTLILDLKVWELLVRGHNGTETNLNLQILTLNKMFRVLTIGTAMDKESQRKRSARTREVEVDTAIATVLVTLRDTQLLTIQVLLLKQMVIAKVDQTLALVNVKMELTSLDLTQMMAVET